MMAESGVRGRGKTASVAGRSWDQVMAWRTWRHHLGERVPRTLHDGGSGGDPRHYLRPVWRRAFGVTRDELEQTVAGIDWALDRMVLTRDELASEVASLMASSEEAEGLAAFLGGSPELVWQG